MKTYVALILLLIWASYPEQTLADESEKPKGETSVEDSRPYSKESIEHYNNAVALHQKGQFADAISQYKEAIASDPRITQAYYNLFVMYAAYKNVPKMNSCLDKLEALNRGRAEKLNAEAEKLQASGQLGEAVKLWDQITRLDPRFKPARKNLADNAPELAKHVVPLPE